MHNPLLNKLIEELTSSEFINIKLKESFLNGLYRHYGVADIDIPKPDLSHDSYVLSLVGGFDECRHQATYYNSTFYYTDYLRDRVVSLFKKLHADYYNKMAFTPFDEKAKTYYATNLLNELYVIKDEIYSNNQIQKDYKIIVVDTFDTQVSLFAKEYRITKSGKVLKHKAEVTYLNYNDSLNFNDNMTVLYESLRNGGLIHTDTSVSDFKKVFTNKSFENKVVWTGSISEFFYFINCLANHENFSGLESNKWITALNCFYVIDVKTGNQITPNKLKGQKTPSLKSTSKIDNYLKI